MKPNYPPSSFEDKSLLLQRFNQKWKANERGCWIWQAAKQKPFSQYSYQVGVIRIGGKYMRASRVCWQIHNGEIPSKQFVLHKCNESLCVNPQHLYLGSHRENMRDLAVSERHGAIKISNEEALNIRNSKEPTKTLCKRYGLERSTVKQIRNGKARLHLHDAQPQPPK